MRALIVMLFLFSNLFAASGGDWKVYLYANVDGVYRAFQFVAMMVNSKLFMGVLTVGVIIILWQAAKSLFEADLRSVITKFALTLALIAFLFLPNSRVHIIDQRVNNGCLQAGSTGSTYAVVDNIPFGLAVITSFATTVTKDLIDGPNGNGGIRSVLSNVDTDLGCADISGTGYGRSFDDLSHALTLADFSVLKDDNAKKAAFDLEVYLMKCIIPALYNSPRSISYLKNPGDQSYVDALKPDNFKITNETAELDGQTVKCVDLYNNNIVPKVSLLQTALFNKFAASVSDLKLVDVNAYADKLYDGFIDRANTLVTASGKLSSLMYEAGVARTSYQAIRQAGIGVGGTIGTAAAGANAFSIDNMILSGIGSMAWMIQVIPLVVNYFTMLVIVLYFPMAIFAVIRPFPGNFKVLANYAMGFVAFESANLALVIVQHIAAWYGASKFFTLYQEVGKNILGASNLGQVAAYTSAMTGVAALLGAIAIPVVVGIIFKGESMGLLSLTSAIRSAYKGIESAGELGARARAEAEYQKNRMHNITSEDRALARYGIHMPDSAQTAKLYAQLQSEIDSINKGAAFAAGTSGAGMGNYMSGSLASSSHAVGRTMGLGSATGAAHAGGAGVLDGITMGSNMHYAAQHMSTAQATALGESDALQKSAKAQGIINSGIAGSNGHIGGSMAADYADGISDKEANRIAGTAAYGANMSAEDSVASGSVAGAADAAGAHGLLKGVAKSGLNNYLSGVENQAAKKTTATATYGGRTSLEQALTAGQVEGVRMSGEDKSATRAIMEHDIKDKEQLLDMVEKGAERAARKKLNETIGLGKISGFKDSHGNMISETQFFAGLQKGAAFGFMSEGIKGEIAGKHGLTTSHDAEGILDGVTMKSSIAKGLGRSEGEKFASMEGKAGAMDKHGHSVSDEEYYQAVKNSETERASSVVGKGAAVSKIIHKDAGMIARNAEYKEASQQLSTNARVSEMGGVYSAASIDAIAAKFKAAADAASTTAKLDFANNKQAIEHFLNAMQAKGMDVSPYYDANGQVKTGMDFFRALAAQSAMVMSGSTAFVGGDGKVFNGAVTPDGKVSGRVSGGVSSTVDNSNTLKDGNYNIGQMRKNIHDGFKSTLMDFGVSEENAEWAADQIILGWDYFQDGLAFVGALSTAKESYDMIKKGVDYLSSRNKKTSSQNLRTNARTPNQVNPHNVNATTHANQFSTTPPSSGSPSSIAHSGGHGNIPSGYTTTQSGLIVPQSAGSNAAPHSAPHSAGGFVSRILRWAAVTAGISSLAGASDTIGNAMNAVDPLSYLMGQPLGDGTIEGAMARGEIPPISPSAASALQGGGNLDQAAINNRLSQFLGARNYKTNEMFLNQLTNPVAPARGITVETLGGRVTFGQTAGGNLQIGHVATKIPFSEFRQYMADPHNKREFLERLSFARLDDEGVSELLAPIARNMNLRIDQALGTIYQGAHGKGDSQGPNISTQRLNNIQ